MLAEGMSGPARIEGMSGPARIDSQCDHLDDSFLGSNEDLKCFAAKFEAINKEVKA